jgi:hypothetical protein
VGPEDDALVGAEAGAWMPWSAESSDELELEVELELELEFVAGVAEAVVLPGMVAAPIAPKIPPPAIPAAAAQTVSRRTPRRPLSRASRFSMSQDSRPELNAN